ncbi:MAG: pyridoxamine 5'-phosphate oxidase [Burkholderiales bacterium]|nr:MAG: pyridoxamine 5'-phosphate oxidase [Burkholderiales bacterium]
MHKLTRLLAHLLRVQRVATLGTLDAHGMPQLSLVPYALDAADPALVIHVSALAAHTGAMNRQPVTALMVHESEPAEGPVHALHRVSLVTRATLLAPSDPDVPRLRGLYLQRFPQAQPITELGDFRFVRLRPQEARQVAGFGAARSLQAAEVVQAICLACSPGDLPDD